VCRYDTNRLRATPDNQMMDLPLPHQGPGVFDRHLRRNAENIRIHHIRYDHDPPRLLSLRQAARNC
jgi:hypothetical protein